MKVLILTEGGRYVGFGHVTRMYAVCQAFEEFGIRPYMIIKGDATVGSVLGDAKWEIFDWIKYPSGIKERFGEIDILLIDSYLAPREVYEYLSEMAKVPAFYDDFGRIDYPCGLVINGNIHAELMEYQKSPCQNYLLGVKYLPMRKEFWEIEDKDINEEVNSILITFGGEDLRNMTPVVLNVLTEHFNNYKKFVIIGKGFRENTIKKIKELSDKRTELSFYPNAEKMKWLMLRSDIAISAGGQTLYELARTGVPTIGVIVADNQKLQAQVMKDKKILIDVFCWDENGFELKLAESINRLEQYKVRYNLSLNGRALVDGRGAARIVNDLLKRFNNMCGSFRENITHSNLEIDGFSLINFLNATKKELEMVRRWRNHPEVKKWMYNQHEITPDEHINFINSLKYSRNKAYWIVKHYTAYIGILSFTNINVIDEYAYLGIYSNPYERIKGAGKTLMSLAIKIAFRFFKLRTLKLEVFESNTRAINLYSKFGFKKEKRFKRSVRNIRVNVLTMSLTNSDK